MVVGGGGGHVRLNGNRGRETSDGLDRERLNPVITEALQRAGAAALFTPAAVRMEQQLILMCPQ